MTEKPHRPWSKFFWSDWQSDPALRLCSLAAQGLWMRLLCVAAEADPIGYVTVNGRTLGNADIARLAGVSEAESTALLSELDQNGVFSRSRNGTIYCRRMVRDAKRVETLRKNGSMGGSPILCNNAQKSRLDNQPDKQAVKPHIPEARVQNTKETYSSDEAASLRRDIVIAFEPLGSIPDTSRVELWMAQGYPADLILSVVRTTLAGNRNISTLNYFDKAIAKAFAERPSQRKPLTPTKIDDINEDQWRSFCEQWLRGMGWSDAFGPAPGEPGCRVPEPFQSQAAREAKSRGLLPRRSAA